MKNLLVTDNLTIEIAGKKICHALNLTIEAGDTLGILGQNGAGKTTLLRTLAGLFPAVSGEIFLHEKKITALTPKIIAQHLAILLQNDTDAFPQSVFEFCLGGRYPHLNYFGWETEDDKQIVLNALLKMTLDKKLAQNIQTLSGGERQRLAIAAVLAQTPKIFLLDEPTNHLDVHQQVIVLNHFKKLTENNSAAVVMALHDINLANHYCNKMLMLFPEGDFLMGLTSHILNQENLSRLYRHPMQNNRESWLPQLQEINS